MPTSKVKRKKRVARIKTFFERVAIVASGTVFVLASLVYIVRLDYFELNAVKIEVDGLMDRSQIREDIASVLSGSYFIFSRRNSLIYPKEEMERSLKISNPRIKEVDIKRRDLNTLEISIVERKPVALWCGENPEYTEWCFYVDEKGFVYSKAPFFSGHVFFRYYGGDVNLKNPLRSFLTSEEEIMEIERFTSHLKDLNIEPNAVHLKEEDFIVLLKGEGSLYLNRGESLEEPFSRLRSLFRGGKQSFVVEGNPAFLYIDLRFGKRVFYKMKEDE